MNFGVRLTSKLLFLAMGLWLSGCVSVRIVGPVSGAVFHEGETIEFSAEAEGAQTTEISWIVDGKPVGKGESFGTSNLPMGWHEVTAELRDTGQSVSDTVYVQVVSWKIVKSPHKKTVTAIARDEIGKQTWLGVSGEGVYRVNDNGEFKHFSVTSGELPSLDIRDLIFYDQEVWVATGVGIARFSGSEWKLFERRDGLPSNDVRALSADLTTSRLWLVTPMGLASWDGRSWESIPFVSKPSTLAARGGLLWVGTEGGEIHRLRGKVWEQMAPAEEKRQGSVQFLVPDVFQPDHVWLVDESNNLARGHDAGREFVLSDNLRLLRTNGAVMEEASGTLWLAEAGSLGILQNSATGVWRRYDAKKALLTLHGSWQALSVDTATGNKWLVADSHIVSLSAAGLPQATLDLPDLVPFPPTDLKVKDSTDGKELVLEVTIVNLGRGDLEVESRKEPERGQRVAIQNLYRKRSVAQKKVVGRFLFHEHEDHDHYHFGALTIYQLRKVLSQHRVGPIVSQTTKVSWCLSDHEPYLEDTEGKHYSCSVKIQGISRGWGDTYYARQFGQSIPLSEVPPGEYWVVVILTGVFAEEKYGNNSSMTRIEIDRRGRIRVLEERVPEGVPMKEIFDAKGLGLTGGS
ncbi:MAG: hypothetical protein GTO40_14945 [Deltaproteobacteria bacterium]|nr:hypothetical protein [Deltaproteobacteria bacterium]